MDKRKIAVILGGMSTEHEVSVISGTSVIKNLNKENYQIIPIYIDPEGIWYEYKKAIEEIDVATLGEELDNIEKIKEPMELLKTVDVIFPVLHGLYGEDGTIQGLLELLKKPYVGCKVLASSVAMDKAYTKIIFEKAGIKQANYMYIRRYKNNYIVVDNNFKEEIMELNEVLPVVEEKLEYPIFVKPSNSGSSVGITKAKNKEELAKAIEYASQFDVKIIIEQGIVGREVECAVLGNEEVIASCVGEVLAEAEFYSYESKYQSSKSQTVIPANISNEKQEEIKQMAIKAFKCIDGKGLSRVDFFIEKGTQDVYINEINTLPGFTQISMYPKLWEASGITYTEVLDRLIELAIQTK